MQLFANSTKNVKNRNKKGNKKTSRRKIAMVMAMTFILSVSTGMQAYAAGTAYTLLNKLTVGGDYPAVQGLAIEKGLAYVLKSGGTNDCSFFYGEKTELKQLKNGKKVISLPLGHGNDMTYRKADKKLYIATMDKYIKRMPLSGDKNKIETIPTKYKVGSIACWLNSDKFILKKHKTEAEKEKDKWSEFHLVEINGTKVKEICTFRVKEDEKKGEELNQGICMYKGYLYVTFWNNDKTERNSSIYRVNEKMSSIEKKGKNTKEIKTYDKTQIAKLDKNDLLKSAKNLEKPPKGTPIKIEIESIAFTTEDYLYFTANAQYLDTAGNKKSLDGLYMINKKMA